MKYRKNQQASSQIQKKSQFIKNTGERYEKKSYSQKHDNSKFSLNKEKDVQMMDLLQKRQTEISRYFMVEKVLRQMQVKPKQTLSQLLKIYGQTPQVFSWQNNSAEKKFSNERRLIFQLVKAIVKYHRDYPFLEQSKTTSIIQRIIQAANTAILLQTKILQETTYNLWHQINNCEFDYLLQRYLIAFLTITMALGKTASLANLCQKLVTFQLKNLIIQIETRKNKTNFFKDIFYNFYNESFEILINITSQSFQIIPYFDIAALSFTSNYFQMYKEILNKSFDYLKLKSSSQRKEDVMQQQGVKQSQSVIKVILLSCNLFNFKSIFSEEGETSRQGRLFYTKEIVFLILYTFKPYFLKLIDEIQKIQRNSVPKDIIQFIFQAATFGRSIDRPQYLKEILAKILSSLPLKQYISKGSPLGETVPSVEDQQSLVKLIEQSLFQLLYRIQQSFCHFNLDLYLDLYIESPVTFMSEYFVLRLFKNQHSQIILLFITKFTKRWILQEIKGFDFNFYLLSFLKKCVGTDSINLIGRYLKGLQVNELLKVNLMIYKRSFEEERKKLVCAEYPNRQVRLANLTAVGLCDKSVLVNKMMPQFAEQLLWKDLINQLYPSDNYMFVKSFYHVVNYEVTFEPPQLDLIHQIIQAFERAVLHQDMEDIFSIFQLLACILYKQYHLMSFQYEQQEQCQQRLLHIVLERHSQLISICEVMIERRRNAMSHVTLKQQIVSQNFKYFQKAKRMHAYFLKTLTEWMQRLPNAQKLIAHTISYERAIQIQQKFSKDNEYVEYRFIKNLSHFCSQKYFNNTLERKVKNKVFGKEFISVTQILMLRQILMHFIEGQKLQQPIEAESLTQSQVIVYFQFVLQSRLSSVNQREILKLKLVAIQTIFELTQHFYTFPHSQQASFFYKIYQTSLKNSIIEIAVQNPDFVSKYQRQLIIHLRFAAIKQVFHFYQTPYGVLNQLDVFDFLFQLTFDKQIEIRFMVLNLITSRFKNQQYKNIHSHKLHIIAYLNNFAIFQPNFNLKTTATHLAQTIKKIGNQQYALGLEVFLYSLKMMLNYIRHNLHRDTYHIFVDFYLKVFDQIWLNKKQWQYLVYVFCWKVFEQKQIVFATNRIGYQSHIQTYMISRQKSDFFLQSQIKQCLKKDINFLNQGEQMKNNLQKQQEIVIRSLTHRICNRVFQIVISKQRNTRSIRNKKDVKINWDVLRLQRIATLEKKPNSDIHLITLSMI